jgi:hypothetical protein
MKTMKPRAKNLSDSLGEHLISDSESSESIDSLSDSPLGSVKNTGPKLQKMATIAFTQKPSKLTQAPMLMPATQINQLKHMPTLRKHESARKRRLQQLAIEAQKEKEIETLNVEKKDFGLVMDDLNSAEYCVLDEFQQVYLSMPTRIAGTYVSLTKTGYYKSSWAVVTGNELYLYLSKDSPNHTFMRVLQGARIECSTSIDA